MAFSDTPMIFLIDSFIRCITSFFYKKDEGVSRDIARQILVGTENPLLLVHLQHAECYTYPGTESTEAILRKKVKRSLKWRYVFFYLVPGFFVRIFAKGKYPSWVTTRSERLTLFAVTRMESMLKGEEKREMAIPVARRAIIY
ncbi:MAG: hypothetical protein Q7S53_02485 [bacterium]|nr:hypothetical protein [bacterium]